LSERGKLSFLPPTSIDSMADTQQLVQILVSTLSPDPTTRRNAERELTQLQSQPSFAHLILQLAQDSNTPKAYRQAAVVNFKGWIRANYGVSYLLVHSSNLDSSETHCKERMIDRGSSYTFGPIYSRSVEAVCRTNHDFIVFGTCTTSSSR